MASRYDKSGEREKDDNKKKKEGRKNGGVEWGLNTLPFCEKSGLRWGLFGNPQHTFCLGWFDLRYTSCQLM